MSPTIITRLTEAGLSDKEARVYAAMLELGPQGAGEIAKQASVHRATTYLALTSLASQGLATSYDDGKQTLFVAETPQRLLHLAEKHANVATEKHQRATTLVPELEALFQSGSNKPVVRFYEGVEGLGHLRDYLRRQRPTISDSFIRLNARLASVAEQDEHQRFDLARSTRSRILYVPDADVPTPRFKPEDLGSRVHIRFSNSVPFDFDGEIGIMDKSAYLATVTPHVHVCVVESEGLARLLRMQFELAWTHASEKRVDVKR